MTSALRMLDNAPLTSRQTPHRQETPSLAAKTTSALPHVKKNNRSRDDPQLIPRQHLEHLLIRTESTWQHNKPTGKFNHRAFRSCMFAVTSRRSPHDEPPRHRPVAGNHTDHFTAARYDHIGYHPIIPMSPPPYTNEMLRDARYVPNPRCARNIGWLPEPDPQRQQQQQPGPAQRHQTLAKNSSSEIRTQFALR